MAQIKYDTYKYTDETEMFQSITDSGYLIPDPFNQAGMLIVQEVEDKLDELDYSYFAQIVTNYPLGEDEEPVYSTEVYINSARIGNSKLPSNKKLTGNERKYFNNYINRFAGEEIVDPVVNPDPE